MGKYRKKAIVIEASQWSKLGDHPEVTEVTYCGGQEISATQPECCGCLITKHGEIDTLEGRMRVCPGDWIITGIKGEYYPCKPDIFAATYDEA